MWELFYESKRKIILNLFIDKMISGLLFLLISILVCGKRKIVCSL